MEYLVRASRKDGVPLPDLTLDLRPYPAPFVASAREEVGVVRLGFANSRHLHFGGPVGSAFHNAMALWKILQSLRKGFAAVERLGSLLGVRRGKLEEGVISVCKNCRAHFRWVLVKELIGRDDRDSKLASLRENRFETAFIGHEVLHLIAIQREN